MKAENSKHNAVCRKLCSMKTFRFKSLIESTNLGKNNTSPWGWAHFSLHKTALMMVRRKRMGCGEQAIASAIILLSLRDSFLYFNETLKPQGNACVKTGHLGKLCIIYTDSPLICIVLYLSASNTS